MTKDDMFQPHTTAILIFLLWVPLLGCNKVVETDEDDTASEDNASTSLESETDSNAETVFDTNAHDETEGGQPCDVDSDCTGLAPRCIYQRIESVNDGIIEYGGFCVVSCNENGSCNGNAICLEAYCHPTCDLDAIPNICPVRPEGMFYCTDLFGDGSIGVCGPIPVPP